MCIHHLLAYFCNPRAYYRKKHRKRIEERPLPEHWINIVRDNFPFYDKLNDEDRELFHTHLKVFFWTKHWEGAGGFEMTEKAKIVVSATAARIARRLPLAVYDRLTKIVIHPGPFHHPTDDSPTYTKKIHAFSILILSWKAVEEAFYFRQYITNVIIRALAHVLDAHDGRPPNGTPKLTHSEDYTAWDQVMGEHLARLQEDYFSHMVPFYGAQNKAQFFAAATETFSQDPRRLQRHEPDLYHILAKYFRLDPVLNR